MTRFSSLAGAIIVAAIGITAPVQALSSPAGLTLSGPVASDQIQESRAVKAGYRGFRHRRHYSGGHRYRRGYRHHGRKYLYRKHYGYRRHHRLGRHHRRYSPRYYYRFK